MAARASSKHAVPFGQRSPNRAMNAAIVSSIGSSPFIISQNVSAVHPAMMISIIGIIAVGLMMLERR
jgi:hypothetical protein